MPGAVATAVRRGSARRIAVTAAAVAGLVAVAGCSSTSGAQPPASRTPADSVSRPGAAASDHGLVQCPSPAPAAAPAWPAQLPADLPKPSPATVLRAFGRAGGIREAQFVVPRSLRDEVLFVLTKLPPAGYVIGRGDSELREADAPFVHGNLRGLIRLSGLAPCRTMWTVVTVASSAAPTAPLLPPHTASPGTGPPPPATTAPFATGSPVR